MNAVMRAVLVAGLFTVMPLPMFGSSVAYAATTEVNQASIDKIISEWKERPRLAAQQIIAKYGAPQEVSSEKLIWHDQGPYKRITAENIEIPHDFPKPHMDYLTHTVAYKVPAEMADELIDFDGSVIIDRTAGEISGRCDLEGHNILTLNLVNDIITGKMNAQQAREKFGEIVVEDVMGKYPVYTTDLQFKPATSAADPGKPVIPGSPERASASPRNNGGEGEILGLIAAVNENEILAAMEAAKKKISSPTTAYAKILHQDHGMNLGKLLKLGQEINVTPMETTAVDKLRVKGAGELAALARINGAEFEKGYLEMMIKGHEEVIAMIDNDLMNRAKSESLKKHLTETRSSVAKHLQEAKSLKAGTN